MEVYCAYRDICDPERNLNIHDAIKRKSKWNAWTGMRRYDCGECKHRLRCLIEPGCNRTFESK